MQNGTPLLVLYQGEEFFAKGIDLCRLVRQFKKHLAFAFIAKHPRILMERYVYCEVADTIKTKKFQMHVFNAGFESWHQPLMLPEFFLPCPGKTIFPFFDLINGFWEAAQFASEIDEFGATNTHPKSGRSCEPIIGGRNDYPDLG